MSYQSIQLLDGTGGLLEDYRSLGSARRVLLRAQLAGPQTAAITALADFINLAALAWRVSQEVDGLGIDAVRASWANGGDPDSRAPYPVNQVGALVHVLCWRPRNGLPLTFGAVMLGGCGRNPSLVIHNYLRETNAEPGTPDGCDRVSKFIWSTSS